jgi:hypothetical protein
MNRGPFADLIDGMIKIGEFNLQIYGSMANVFAPIDVKPASVAPKRITSSPEDALADAKRWFSTVA